MRVTTISLVSLLFLAVTTTASAEGSIPWVYDMGEAQQMAQRDQRRLLLHFYADWCGPCRSLEQSVFPDANVGRTLAASYIPVKIDVDKNQELAKRYGVTQIPTDVITDAQGHVLYQTGSPSSPIQYVQLLTSMAANGGVGASVHAVSTQIAQQNTQAASPSQTAWNSPWLDQGRDSGAADSYRSQLPAASEYGGAATPRDRSSDVTAPNSYTGQAGRQETWGQTRWQPNGTNGAWQEGAAAGTSAAAPTALNSAPPAPGGRMNPYANTAVNNRPADPVPLLGGNNYQADQGHAPSNADNQINNPPQAASGWNQQATAAPNSTGGGFGNPYAQSGNAPVAPPTNPSPSAGPPLALDGFCPVTLAEEEKWEKGNPAWGALHRGRTYLFQGQQQQQLFLADPDRYSPVLSGYDPTRYVDSGEPVPGLRQHGMWFRGKIYLFASEGSLDQFARNPEHYAQRSHEIMMTAGR